MTKSSVAQVSRSLNSKILNSTYLNESYPDRYSFFEIFMYCCTSVNLCQINRLNQFKKLLFVLKGTKPSNFIN